MTTPSSINTMGTATAIPMHAGPQDAGSSAGTGAGVVDWLLMAIVYGGGGGLLLHKGYKLQENL